MLHKHGRGKLHFKWLIIYPQELSRENSTGNNITAYN